MTVKQIVKVQKEITVMGYHRQEWVLVMWKHSNVVWVAVTWMKGGSTLQSRDICLFIFVVVSMLLFINSEKCITKGGELEV